MHKLAGEGSRRWSGREEMTAPNAIAYYRSREQHARSMAQSAISPEIARIYLQMAARYAHVAGEMAGD